MKPILPLLLALFSLTAHASLVLPFLSLAFSKPNAPFIITSRWHANWRLLVSKYGWNCMKYQIISRSILCSLNGYGKNGLILTVSQQIRISHHLMFLWILRFAKQGIWNSVKSICESCIKRLILRYRNVNKSSDCHLTAIAFLRFSGSLKPLILC